MFKKLLVCSALSLAAFLSNPLSAEVTEKEIARVDFSVNFGFFGCPSPCYGPCYYDMWYGRPCYGGPCFVPYPGPYWYGCRPCPPYYAW